MVLSQNKPQFVSRLRRYPHQMYQHSVTNTVHIFFPEMFNGAEYIPYTLTILLLFIYVYYSFSKMDLVNSQVWDRPGGRHYGAELAADGAQPRRQRLRLPGALLPGGAGAGVHAGGCLTKRRLQHYQQPLFRDRRPHSGQTFFLWTVLSVQINRTRMADLVHWCRSKRHLITPRSPMSGPGVLFCVECNT